ncbi:MAG TPA: OB-fold nucleic acid binding domain-containing protein [Anaerolineae bacterium]|jgi:DNA/RNA endonuclease YhcR with UshA esterase domain
MRLLKGLIIILAIGGVAALVLASRASSRPLTKISSLNPAMNFAYVRISGKVFDFPIVSPTDGYLSFTVNDQSGDVRVTAYRSTVDELMKRNQIPLPGSVVTAEGTLRLRDDEPTLTLNMPEALEINTPASTAASIGALNAFNLGERVTVSGQVRRVRVTGDTYQIVTLREGAAEADMVIPYQSGDMFGKAPSLVDGTWISVTGSVNEYRGKRELMVSHAEDIKSSQAMSFDARPLEALNRSMIGQWVAVNASISKLRPMKQGMLIDLRDDAGHTLTVVMFDQWYRVPFSATLQTGSRISVQGELVDFHGALEIQPEFSFDLIKHQ